MRKPQSYYLGIGLLRRDEVAEMLGVSIRAIDQWKLRGLPHIKKKGVSIRYEAQAVLDWMKDKK